MHGFFNRILAVDLAGSSSSYQDVPDAVLATTLGGKGLAAHLLMRTPTGVDALAPEAAFIVAVGPLAGTRMWSHSRFGAYGKSPATGGWGESYCGGTLAPRIKGCGVDAVVITGKAKRLTYLVISEDGVEFRDATHLAGADSYETEAAIVEAASTDERPAGAMVIGPAGENLVRFACIKTDRWRSLGRGGMGAILGSKNVKGICFNGSLRAEMADPEGLAGLIRRIRETGSASPVTEKYRKLGTPMQVAVTNDQGCFPTQYWKSGHFDGWRSISADYMQEHFDLRPHGCPNCFLQCTKHSTVREGRHRGLEIDGPEYETIYALGGLNCVDSLEEITWLNDVCDRLGIDTMSAGNVSALAVEAHRRGLSPFAIDYNQPDRMAELFTLLARREGEGAIYSDGVLAAARNLGIEDLAVHAKGLEPAGFDPRVLKGMGLSYATAARGACHLRGTFYKAELSGQIDKSATSGKAELHVDYEDRAAIFDSLILCRFFRDFILWEDLVTLVRSTTGMDVEKEDLADLANRITQQSRGYNAREGLGPDADTLSVALLDTPNAQGAILRSSELEEMIRDYDAIRSRRDRK